MNPETLLKAVLVAANAQTPADKARAAWRFNDYLWSRVLRGECDIGTARAFNNVVQEQEYPWLEKKLFEAGKLCGQQELRLEKANQALDNIHNVLDGLLDDWADWDEAQIQRCLSELRAIAGEALK